MSEKHAYGDGLPEELSKPKLNSLVVWMLVLLPLGIFAGTAYGLYFGFNKKKELVHRASKKISSDEIHQIMTNYAVHFGDRTYETEEGIETLKLVEKNITGELQTNNSMLLNGEDKSAFEAAGLVWKSSWVDVAAAEPEKVFYLATSYDGRQSLGNASKIALMITTAKSLAGVELDYTLRFVFLPKQQPMGQQVEWINAHCKGPAEKNIGVFFLGHYSAEEGKKNRQEGTWSVTDGDIAWGQELMKESRVMHYGAANIHHAVLDKSRSYTESDVSEIEQAARGLREILFFVLGGDR